MRYEYLSDHAGHIADTAEAEFKVAKARLANDVAAFREAQTDLDVIRRSKAWWRRLFGISTQEEREQHALAWQRRERAAATRTGVERRRQRLDQTNAGAAGEHQLAAWLNDLPDSWTGLHGYRNRAGEIDTVVIGPGGIWAIETKYRNVTIDINGDTWRYTKYDRWGNAVDSGAATDNSGRSWAAQVGEPAAKLQRWLERNHSQVPVRTAVVLMHPNAAIRAKRNPTVDVVATHADGPRNLLDAMSSTSTPVTAEACQEIVRLATRDHHFHARRRK